MQHQDLVQKVLTSKHKSHQQSLHNKVLDDKDVKTIKKGKDGQVNVEGKKLHKILESESLDVPTDDVGFKRALLQARTAKGVKQKDFALKMGVKESVLRKWENGDMIPENHLIAKMEQILGTKLPRPKKVKL